MKKIALAVFAGVALLGILTAVVGYAMGGGGGSLNVRDGHWVYNGREGTVQLGSAPYWAQRLGKRIQYGIFWGPRWPDDEVDEIDVYDGDDDDDWDDDDDYDDYDYNYEYNYNYRYDYNFVPGSNKVDNVALPVDASQLTKIDIDISAGFVVVKTGDTPGLKVEGPLDYRTYMEEGAWHIDSKHHNLKWRDAGFWLNGRNMSTKFTLTIPESLDNLDVNISAGDANLRGLDLSNLDVEGGAATISLTNIAAETLDLSIQAGDINADNVDVAAEADFSCQAGAINYQGVLSGKVDAECQAGSINIVTVRPPDYGWSISAQMADVTIDGQGGGGLNTSITGGNQNALPYFELDSSVGSISVSFT